MHRIPVAEVYRNSRSRRVDAKSRLQNVQVATTVLSAEQLKAAGMEKLEDVRLLTPRLQIQPDPYLMRDKRQLESLIAGDQSVAAYIGEMPLAYPNGSNLRMFDLQSVRVPKSAQGTLFGRNSRVVSSVTTYDFAAVTLKNIFGDHKVFTDWSYEVDATDLTIVDGLPNFQALTRQRADQHSDGVQISGSLILPARTVLLRPDGYSDCDIRAVACSNTGLGGTLADSCEEHERRTSQSQPTYTASRNWKPIDGMDDRQHCRLRAYLPFTLL